MSKVAFVLLGALALASATEVTPTQKVIQLLDGMVAKGKAEKQAEEVQFAAYKQYCDDTSNEKKNMIAEANEQMEILAADIQKYDADAEKLGHEIDELDHDLAGIEADMKEATKIRAMEHADFLEDQTDYTQSVEQISLAVDTLKSEQGNVDQAAALLQVLKLPTLEAHEKKVIQSYLARSPEDIDAENLAAGAPEAHAFESSSQGIVDLFEKMKDKFEGKVADNQKDEMEDKHGFEMMITDLQNAKTTATNSREAKSEAKAKAHQDSADSAGALGDTTAARDADKKMLADLEATCAQKASDFEQRQQLRAEEIEALQKATEILAGGEVAGAAAKHLPAMLQKKASSFVQLRASAKNPNQERVAAFLKDEGARLNSKVLAALSMRVAYDPFKSVKKMIKDLITKLMEEANQEAEHKGWCDQEMGTNEQTRKEKTESVEVLTAEIDELEANINQLTMEINELTTAVAENDKAMSEATDLRETEKAKNIETIADAKAAQEAVASALTVLKDFYEKAGKATSLVQTAKQPEIFDAPYTGMQSNAGGVVGMIEVIQSDFARLETETASSEAASQKEYEEFSHDSAVDKQAKTKDIDYKSTKKTNAESALTEKKMDLEGTQKELEAALAYYEKLKPACVDSGISYEDRVARRKEEIESLQEALRILNGDDIA